MFFQQTLGRAVRLFPHATATIDGERRQSFIQLHASTLRLAAWLASEGLCPGDRVAVLLPNSQECLELTFASTHQ